MIPKDRRFRCFRGHTPGQCPLHNTETEKMLYAILAVIASTLAVMCALLGH